jgi:hypothetical protein
LKSVSSLIALPRMGETTSSERETSINECDEMERMRVCSCKIEEGESHRKVIRKPEAVALGKKVRLSRLCSRILSSAKHGPERT